MLARKRLWLPLVIAILFLAFYKSWTRRDDMSFRVGGLAKGSQSDAEVIDDGQYFWRELPTRYPVQRMKRFPSRKPLSLPKVQASFPKESDKERKVRTERQQTVKDAFKRCWNSYKTRAFKKDELAPISGGSKDSFGGWGATLVDSLDTLWVMGLHEEFKDAAAAAAEIDFEKSSLETVNIFETNIRYLGGFLAAYDLSGYQQLLRKAREVGDMLYVTFDTPNRMPITRWNFENATKGGEQVAPESMSLAEIGSFGMEFTRLSLVTGDPRWHDAVERIREVLKEQQGTTLLPGLWPITLNPRTKEFNHDSAFSLGANADSGFEYLSKMYGLVGGLIPSYQKMYEDAMNAALEHNLWRPMLPGTPDILISGIQHVEEDTGKTTLHLEPQGQHLVCYAGGMLAVGGKLFNHPTHLKAARKLVDGCIWTYNALPLGVMPEIFYMHPCDSKDECVWDETRWKQAVLERAGEVDLTNLTKADEMIASARLPMGFTQIPDPFYILRPEAIESVFILYRVTGRRDLLESAWAMFEAVQDSTKTELANAAISDVTVDKDPAKMDSMESFWMSETLKYFYLIFSEPNLISLDEWVFNTEAHPFKRLRG